MAQPDPCPHCGAAAIASDPSGPDNVVRVSCSGVDCPIVVDSPSGTPAFTETVGGTDAAVEFWNQTVAAVSAQGE